MSKRVSPYPEKVFSRAPPYVLLPLELTNSDAWTSMSINCFRLITFLMNEHMGHAGSENGDLLATYDQLTAFGISRRLVHKTITEAESKGLILVERGGRKGFVNHISKFTLTFFPMRYRGENGEKLYVPPSDKWKAYKHVKKSENNITK